MSLKKHRWGKLLFVGYCLWMLWLLYGQRIGNVGDISFSQYLSRAVNLKPLRTIGNYWYVVQRTADPALIRHIVINLVGNVVMFIPLGYFLPLNWQFFRRSRRLMLCTFCIISCIELLQMATMLGSLDIDDVILNLAGCALGYLCWKILHR